MNPDSLFLVLIGALAVGCVVVGVIGGVVAARRAVRAGDEE